MGTVANIKGYINGSEWGVYNSGSNFYQEFVTSWHNAYLQDTEERTGLATLLEQINGNKEYYYNNLSAGGHINESLYTQEQGIEGAVGESEGFTYDIISGQEIPDNDFDIDIHMGIFYGGLSGGEDSEFGYLGGE